jgi:hypothetical protein
MALTDNIAAYWKFDDSTNLVDSVAAITLTNNGTTTFPTGFILQGPDFGSSNSTKWLEVANGLGITTGAMTMAGWVNITTAPGSGVLYILVGVRSNGNLDWSIRYNNSGGTLQVLGTSSGSTQTNITVNQTLTTGTWYFLTVAYDGSSTYTLYLNASSIGTATKANTGAGGTGTFFGANFGGSGQFSSCKMDEWGFWTRALTGTEITTLYNSGAGLQYPFTGNTVKPRRALLGVGV